MIQNDVSPFDYVLGFGAVTALISVIDMIEILRLIILVGTAFGMFIKLVEQYHKSEPSLKLFYSKIKSSWKKIKNKIKN